MRGMATLPQGNQELLVVRDKVGRHSGELGVSKSMECDTISIQCSDTVGWATGRHLACRKLDVGLLMVTIWLELCTTYSSSCHHSPPPSSIVPIKSRVEISWYWLTRKCLLHECHCSQNNIEHYHCLWMCVTSSLKMIWCAGYDLLTYLWCAGCRHDTENTLSCPVCKVTLRSGDYSSHVRLELDRLSKISRLPVRCVVILALLVLVAQFLRSFTALLRMLGKRTGIWPVKLIIIR